MIYLIERIMHFILKSYLVTSLLFCFDPSVGILVVLQILHKKMLACFTRPECISKLYIVLDRNLFSDPFKG